MYLPLRWCGGVFFLALLLAGNTADAQDLDELLKEIQANQPGLSRRA